MLHCRDHQIGLEPAHAQRLGDGKESGARRIAQDARLQLSCDKLGEAVRGEWRRMERRAVHCDRPCGAFHEVPGRPSAPVGYPAGNSLRGRSAWVIAIVRIGQAAQRIVQFARLTGIAPPQATRFAAVNVGGTWSLGAAHQRKLNPPGRNGARELLSRDSHGPADLPLVSFMTPMMTKWVI